MAGASVAAGDKAQTVERVSTDSRTIQPAELFVALVGDNFDGHRFVEAVAQKGPPARLFPRIGMARCRSLLRCCVSPTP